MGLRSDRLVHADSYPPQKNTYNGHMSLRTYPWGKKEGGDRDWWILSSFTWRRWPGACLSFTGGRDDIRMHYGSLIYEDPPPLNSGLSAVLVLDTRGHHQRFCGVYASVGQSLISDKERPTQVLMLWLMQYILFILVFGKFYHCYSKYTKPNSYS